MATDHPQPAPSAPGTSLSARVATLTDVGKKRGHNEDSHVVLTFNGTTSPKSGEMASLSLQDPGVLLVIADGMGGHHGGDIASQTAVATIVREIVAQVKDAGAPPDLRAALQKAVVAAHQAVFAYAQEFSKNQTMGTTMTAVLVHGLRAEIAEVGDSRAYLFRNGTLVQLTQDQTVGNKLRDRGGDPDMVSPQIKDLLTQAVGAQEKVDVVMTTTELEPKDQLLLCSDGLYKVVDPGGMVAALEREASAAEKARLLVEKANENGGPDNITAIVAEICASPTSAA